MVSENQNSATINENNGLSPRYDHTNELPVSSDVTLNSETNSAMGDPEKELEASHDRDLENDGAVAQPAGPEKPGAPQKDPNLVEFEGPDDPENPQNMPYWKKWVLTMALSSMTMWITFASSVFSTATMVTAKEFDVSTEVMTLGTSLVVFGFALGPLMWSPMSELYGRRLPLFFGYAVFSIFQIPVAVAQNLQTIMICRFLMGVFGCSPLAVVGGAMADFWNPIDRAVAIAMFSAATFVGPVLGMCLDFKDYFHSSTNVGAQAPSSVVSLRTRTLAGAGRPGSP